MEKDDLDNSNSINNENDQIEKDEKINTPNTNSEKEDPEILIVEQASESNNQQILIELSHQSQQQQAIDGDQQVPEQKQIKKTQPEVYRKKSHKKKKHGKKSKSQALIYKYKTESHSNRCNICKKKGAILGCKTCIRAFHLKCINMQEADIPKKFYCEICKERLRKKKQLQREKCRKKKQKMEEKEKEKKKQLKLDMMILDPLKEMAKFCKIQESPTQKRFEEFSEIYPQYIQNGKIKFPIDDILFQVYDELFPDVQNLPKMPQPKSYPFVPTKFLGDILYIWNFFSTYNKYLGKLNLTQEKIYVMLNYDGSEIIELVNDMHIVLLNYIYQDILQVQAAENQKEYSENPFFILNKYFFDNNLLDEILPYIWTEYIRNIQNVPDLIQFYDEKKIISQIELLAKEGCLNYNSREIELKIDTLICLINCLSESKSFHEKLAEKAEKLQSKQKQKNDLIQLIKQEEGELLQLKQNLKQQEESQKNRQATLELIQNRSESLKLYREQDKERKETQKTKSQITKLEQQLDKHQEKFDKLTQRIPYYLQTAQCLGYDQNNSDYWFFIKDNGKIYVHFKTNLCDNEPKWYFWDQQEEVNQILASLNVKGIKQRNLHRNIKNLIDQGTLFFDSKQKEKIKKKLEEKLKKQQDELKKKQLLKLSKSSSQLQSQIVENSDTMETESLVSDNNKQNEDTNSDQPHLQQNASAKQLEESDQDNKNQSADLKSFSTISASSDNHGKPVKESKDTLDIIKEEAYEQPSSKTVQQIMDEQKNQLLQEILLQNLRIIQPKDVNIQARNTRQQTKLKSGSISLYKYIKNALIIDLIFQTEKRFSSYLSLKKCCWASFDNRTRLLYKIKQSKSVQEINELLTEINEKFNTVLQYYVNSEAEEHQQEEQKEQKEQKESPKNPQKIGNKKKILDEDEDENEYSSNLNQINQCLEEIISSQDENTNFPIESSKQSGQEKPQSKQELQQQELKKDNLQLTYQHFKQNYLQQDFEKDQSYLVRKKQLKIWGVSNEKLKKGWQLYNVDNTTSLFIKTFLFNQVIMQYCDKKLQDLNEQLKIEQVQGDELDLDLEYGKKEKKLKKLRELDDYRYQSNNQEIRQQQQQLMDICPIRRSDRITKEKYLNLNEKQWDEQCKVCNDYGEVICCDTCSNVFHPNCIGLKEIPAGKWSCYECQQKLAEKMALRQTRSSSRRLGM